MMSPLAERQRPQKLSDIIGQDHITGEGSVLANALANNQLHSLLLWGPPGTGKTSIANVIAETLSIPFFKLSAVSAGVKEVREILKTAEKLDDCILFIDEIHRFNKSQQDALLHAVEKGTITLIGATTENPSFEVNSALLSRCQVFVLKSLGKEQLQAVLAKALTEDAALQQQKVSIQESEALLKLSGGDARKLLNVLELVLSQSKAKEITITNELVSKTVNQKMALYDKTGEQHYDIISAFIKSMRGSDPNAAVYYLARMIAGGEDVKFIARRMIIFASEDIGNANPNALLLANASFEAANKIGYPEARIILSQCAVYLATSVKSNATYVAINDALSLVKKTGDLSIPMQIRNAPTSLMKDLNYGKGYQYDHNAEGNFSEQELLPTEIKGTVFYEPGKNPAENKTREKLRAQWKEKYGY
jgi:putative ATPase